MATRREFLAGAAGFCLTAGLARAADAPRLMSATHAGTGDGGIVWREDGAAAFPLPGRGHALAHLPDGRILMMGRRPGLFAAAIDPADPGAKPHTFEPAPGCRFSGHACVSPDGRLLVTSEFEATGIEAKLVVRDPATGSVRERWHPGGLEPHEILFAKGGARLVAAIGGLIKDGGVAGPALNPGGIESALVEIDPLSGRVLARHVLPAEFRSLSLRHLALAPDGETVAVAAQDQDLSETRPLIGLLSPGKDIELLPRPDPAEFDFRGYVGSVAIDRGGEFVAAASPRGGLVGFWSIKDGRWCGGLAIADVCGLAAGPEVGTFWASTGLGSIVKIATGGTGPRIATRWQTATGFDNHLIVV